MPVSKKLDLLFECSLCRRSVCIGDYVDPEEDIDKSIDTMLPNGWWQDGPQTEYSHAEGRLKRYRSLECVLCPDCVAKERIERPWVWEGRRAKGEK